MRVVTTRAARSIGTVRESWGVSAYVIAVSASATVRGVRCMLVCATVCGVVGLPACVAASVSIATVRGVWSSLNLLQA